MNMNVTHEELERIADYLPVGIMVFDTGMQIRLWNDLALQLTGIGIEDVLSGNYSAALDEKVLAMLAAGRENETPAQQHLLLEKNDKTVSFTIKRMPNNNAFDTILIAEDATKLLQVERIKRDFIGVLLHKLRGPLSTLKTSFAMMQGGAAQGLAPQVQEILGMGHHEVDRLVTLVNDLRDLFLIETGLAEKDMEREEFLVSVAVNRAVDDLAKMPEPFGSVRRRLVLKGYFDARVIADFEKLKKVFLILLKNALLYSSDKTSVVVEWNNAVEFVDIKVQDFGIGISTESIPLLFGKYFRESNRVTKTVEGNGLGLFIAKSFIELMKGTIYCESSQGTGSVFFLSLPQAQRG
jgi:NtrC-family two-component system sensor histidine kinase KinB